MFHNRPKRFNGSALAHTTSAPEEGEDLLGSGLEFEERVVL